MSKKEDALDLGTIASSLFALLKLDSEMLMLRHVITFHLKGEEKKLAERALSNFEKKAIEIKKRLKF